MAVDPAKAKAAGRTITHEETTYYFCSEDCQQRFLKHSARHAVPATPTGVGHGSHEHGAHHP